MLRDAPGGAPQHEGYRAVVRDSNCFLKVSLFSPARDAGIACVPITGGRRRIIWRVETMLDASIANRRSIASIQRSSGEEVTNPVCVCLCRVMGTIILALSGW